MSGIAWILRQIESANCLPEVRGTGGGRPVIVPYFFQSVSKVGVGRKALPLQTIWRAEFGRLGQPDIALLPESSCSFL